VSEAWHKCEALGCNRRQRAMYAMCGAHKSILGWRAHAALQVFWLSRSINRADYKVALSNAQALIDQGHVNARTE
jgi:hypothetical protein